MNNTRQYFLLVEGENDKHAVYHLLSQNGISVYCEKSHKNKNNSIQIQTGEYGKGGFHSIFDMHIDRYIKFSNKLGIVGDFDRIIDNRWNITRTKLEKGFNIGVPTENNSGCIVEIPKDNLKTYNCEKIGIWLMPNNTSEGTIEDFLLELIDKNDNELYKQAKNAIDELTKLEHLIEKENRFKPAHKQKALLNTYLSWKNKPANPYGKSIKENIINAQSSYAQTFIAWIKAIFPECIKT